MLAPPEADLHIAVVDVAGVKNAGDAAAHAWTAFRSTTHRHAKLVTGRPPRQGWDDGRRTLTIRDGQHEYVYSESQVAARAAQ